VSRPRALKGWDSGSFDILHILLEADLYDYMHQGATLVLPSSLPLVFCLPFRLLLCVEQAFSSVRARSNS